MSQSQRELERYGADASVYREAAKANGASGKYVPGRVITQSKRAYRIVTDKGEYLGEVSGRFRHGASGIHDFPAVGDYVLCSVSHSTGKAVIHEVLTRRTAFERMVAGNTPRIQVIATNIDIVFICMSLNSNYNPSRLERYLAVAWRSGARPVVLLTKCDMAGENMDEILEEVQKIARGAEVLVTSALDVERCARIRELVPLGVTAAFIGSSGVGKSTLVNVLLGCERQATAEIRESDHKGRHTTSMREMLAVPGGGVVIDTPGMRELGIDTVDLFSSFSDIEELALACRFSDCRHETEPDCAVLAAVEAGELDARRLESYVKLRRESTRR